MSEQKAIYKAIMGIHKGLMAIDKTQKNQSQHFNFRGIDDVYNALNPLMKENEVIFLIKILDNTRTMFPSKSGGQTVSVVLKVEYTLLANDGSSISLEILGEGLDYGDKATSKALAMAHKYAILQMFAIPTKDMEDPDAESPEIGNEAKTKYPTPKVTPRPEIKEAPEYATDIQIDKIRQYGVLALKHKTDDETVDYIVKKTGLQIDSLYDLRVEEAVKLIKKMYPGNA